MNEIKQPLGQLIKNCTLKHALDGPGVHKGVCLKPK